VKNNNKTKTYNVLSIFGVKLGVIKWFTNWRKYTFFPDENTVYDTNYIMEIKLFIDKLMDEHNDN